MESIGMHEPIHDDKWHRINRNPAKEKDRRAKKDKKWIDKIRYDIGMKSGLVI